MTQPGSYIAILFLVLALAQGPIAPAQESPVPSRQPGIFTLSRVIAGEIADFTVDNLGNIYLLGIDNRLKKVSPTGDSLAVFNDVRRYGKVSFVDATNPLKLLVYYREFTTIIELDRYLNIVNTIDLRNLNILQAKAIGPAYNNDIWVYDELEARLKRVRDDGTLADQTSDFRQLFDTVPDPAYICDQGGLVYLYDVSKGLYAFDHYGGLKTHIVLPGWLDFQVIDKQVLGRDRQKLFRYQLGTLDMREEPIPAGCLDAIRIKITPVAIYALKRSGLEVYTRNP